MAYLGVDVGGSKTLVALFSDDGVIQESTKFQTPQNYPEFINTLGKSLETFKAKQFSAVAIALPGRIDRKNGIGISLGNLPWKNFPILADAERLTKSSVFIENDANLGGLSEAKLIDDKFHKILYLTVSTGIGGGIIVDRELSRDFIDFEPGQMLFEHNGVTQKWEEFASGRAIVRDFGKRAEDITDLNVWRKIVANLSLGILDLIATVEPDLIIIGGGVGTYFDRFGDLLVEQINRYNNPLTPIPPIRGATRSETAVVYGCYELAKANHGTVH